MSAPTWYDLLGVDPDAPADVIRAAWRRAIAKLDPTDRRFQRLSEAAAVLLDDHRRAEYDATLADATPEEPPSDLAQGASAGTDPSAASAAQPAASRVGAVEGDSEVSASEGSGPSAASAAQPAASRVGAVEGDSEVSASEGSGPSAASAAQPAASRVGANVPERSEERLAPTRRPERPERPERLERPERPERERPEREPRPTRRTLVRRGRRSAELPEGTAASAVGDRPLSEPGIVDVEPAAAQVGRGETQTRRSVALWVLVVTAVVALLLVVLAAYAWSRPDPKAIESGADAARAAAERAVVPVLSYDYRSLADGQKKAESYLTTRYRDRAFRPLFATIEQNAPSTQTVVTTKVVDSAIVRAGEDRVAVLLLVDRPTTNRKQTTPVTYEDHVTVTMERSGGRWLIDDMAT